MRTVRVNGDGVVLPDGNRYDTGAEVVLTDTQFRLIRPILVGTTGDDDGSTLITDLGSDLFNEWEQGRPVFPYGRVPHAATASRWDLDNEEVLADVAHLRTILGDLVGYVHEVTGNSTGGQRVLSDFVPTLIFDDDDWQVVPLDGSAQVIISSYPEGSDSIEYSVDGGPWVDTEDVVTFTIAPLDNGVEVQIRIRSYNNDEIGPPSDPKSVMPEA